MYQLVQSDSFWSINEEGTSDNEIEKGESWSLLGNPSGIFVKGTPGGSRTDRSKMEPLKKTLQKMAKKKIPAFTGVIYIPSRELTYPTLGSWENHRLKMPFLGGYVNSLEGISPPPQKTKVERCHL